MAKSKKRNRRKGLTPCLAAEREFAENSPMPPARELAENRPSTAPAMIVTRFARSGSGPVAEVTPPRSSVKAVLDGFQVFGSGKRPSAGAKTRRFHFGDTQAAVQAMGSDAASANGGKPAAKNWQAKAAAEEKPRNPGLLPLRERRGDSHGQNQNGAGTNGGRVQRSANYFSRSPSKQAMFRRKWRRGPSGYSDGRKDVGRIRRARFKTSEGLLERFWLGARDRYADQRERHYRPPLAG